MKLNYEQDLHIDDNALDLEWLGQPTLMVKYIQGQASARREVDRLKEKLNVSKAELDREIRLSPDKYGIEKITESVITSTIIIQDEYKKLVKELIDAQYELQMMQGAVAAIDQRKQALENLVKLYGQQYFAGPKMPRDLSYEVKLREQKDRSNSTIQIRRTKT